MRNIVIKRMDIVFIVLPEEEKENTDGKGKKYEHGSVQQGKRYGVVVSNDMANRFSPVVHVIPLTSSTTKKQLPTHLDVEHECLDRNSIALGESVLPIDKRNIKRVIGKLDDKYTNEINKALAIQFSIPMAI